MDTAKNFKESDLYEPIKKYFVSKGYSVYGEVKDCDITAAKAEELIIIELKKQLNIKLLAQAVERQKLTDKVYLGIPKPHIQDKEWNQRLQLIKKLQLGLIYVDINSYNNIEIALEPSSPAFRRSPKKRATVENEISNRSGDYNIGGTTGKKVVTAYKEKAIILACALQNNSMPLKKIKELTQISASAKILRENFYNWYARNEKEYCLSAEGKTLLLSPPEELTNIVTHYKEKYQYANSTK